MWNEISDATESKRMCKKSRTKILVTGKTRDGQVPLMHSWRTGGFRTIIAI